MDFSIVEKAGLTQGEFAWLCGVSRVTANKWLHGGAVHPLLKSPTATMLDRIRKAVEKSALPLAYDAEAKAVPKYGRVRNGLKSAVGISSN